MTTKVQEGPQEEQTPGALAFHVTTELVIEVGKLKGRSGDRLQDGPIGINVAHVVTFDKYVENEVFDASNVDIWN